MKTSRISSKIQYKPQDKRTFTPLMNKHSLSGCGTTVNFEKLATLSSILTAAIM